MVWEGRMNWQAFQSGALGVLQWASYGIGLLAFGRMWGSDDRKGALWLTLALALTMLLFGCISGFGVYIGTR